MTNTVESEAPARHLPAPGRFLAWSIAPALATMALASWLMLRPPPVPYRIPAATVCVVAAGATGILLLAALFLFIAGYFTDRLNRIEQQQNELRSYIVAHGAQIARLDDQGQQTCRHTKRLSKGLDELRDAYVVGPQARL